MLLPVVAQAITTAAAQDGLAAEVQVADVELAPGGVLQGQLLASDTAPLPFPRVELRDGAGRATFAELDQDGHFVFSPLSGGVYQLVMGEDVWVIRTWAPGTAPPSATADLTLAPGDTTVRAQYHAPPFLNSMARCIKYGARKPLVVGSVLAVAVGVPVIVHNIDQDDQS